MAIEQCIQSKGALPLPPPFPLPRSPFPIKGSTHFVLKSPETVNCCLPGTAATYHVQPSQAAAWAARGSATVHACTNHGATTQSSEEQPLHRVCTHAHTYTCVYEHTRAHTTSPGSTHTHTQAHDAGMPSGYTIRSSTLIHCQLSETSYMCRPQPQEPLTLAVCAMP